MQLGQVNTSPESELVSLTGPPCSSNATAEQSTNVHYKIDDGTGAIDVKQWTSDEEPEHSSAVRQSLQEGKYVRVVGQLRSFNGDRNVTGFNIRPVTDMNEITVNIALLLHISCTPTRAKCSQAFWCWALPF